MLAYCTIENIGIIGMGIGLGLMGLGNSNAFLVVAGFGGALLHTLNHSLFKSLLFFSAGSVYQQTHTKNMEKLGGLIRQMPQTAWLFLIGSLAIGGLPPFNGFISEFILYRGFLEGVKSTGFYFTALMIVSIACLAIIGGLSLLAFTKSFGTIFLGSPRTVLEHKPHEVSVVMRIPQFIIVAVMLSIGICPQVYFSEAAQTVVSIFPSASFSYGNVLPSSVELLSRVGVYSLLFLVVAGVVYGIRNGFVRRHSEHFQPTWGCAYSAPNTGMQYTGKSFSKSLAKLVGLAVSEKKKYSEITSDEIFPKHRHYSSNYLDGFATYINLISDRLLFVMNYFQFIQNGKIQMYILYGLIFIVLVFLGSLFNFI
jgi:NADH:ubiquinone oxidoreductase subunit 5 (subunit L)/multisubunit Na+/H+ antiporter MnhA subunit